MACVLSVVHPGEDDKLPNGEYVVSLTKDEAEWILSVANRGNQGEIEVKHDERVPYKLYDGLSRVPELGGCVWGLDGKTKTFCIDRTTEYK